MSAAGGRYSAVSTEARIMAGRAVDRMSFDSFLSKSSSMRCSFLATYPVAPTVNRITICKNMSAKPATTPALHTRN